MDLNNDTKNVVTLFVLSSLLMFALVSSGCFQSESDKNRITAQEGFEKAKDLSDSQNEKAVLESVACLDSPKKGGKSPRWSFDYIAPLENGTYVTSDIIINGDLKGEVSIGGYVNKSKRTPKPLLNWTIDSDEAYDIAKENQKISGYLDEYDDAEVDQMQLDMWEEYSKDDAIWIIKWRSGGLGPRWAEIVINAHTGDVLHVEADN